MTRSFPMWLISNLGICGRCMRQSFAAALLASTSAAAAGVWVGPSAITALLASGALGLLLLWMAHIVAYAARAAAGLRPGDHAGKVADPSRRTFLPSFAKVLVGAALATALPARLAHADVTCSSSQWCCRHDFSRCSGGYCPCTQCCNK